MNDLPVEKSAGVEHLLAMQEELDDLREKESSLAVGTLLILAAVVLLVLGIEPANLVFLVNGGLALPFGGWLLARDFRRLARRSRLQRALEKWDPSPLTSSSLDHQQSGLDQEEVRHLNPPNEMN